VLPVAHNVQNSVVGPRPCGRSAAGVVLHLHSTSGPAVSWYVFVVVAVTCAHTNQSVSELSGRTPADGHGKTGLANEDKHKTGLANEQTNK
jgi:hypothetical protein